MLGPFRIIKRINPVAFCGDLQPQFRIHDAFDTTLLESYHPSALPGQQLTPLPLVEMETGDKYDVEEILDPKKT